MYDARTGTFTDNVVSKLCHHDDDGAEEGAATKIVVTTIPT